MDSNKKIRKHIQKILSEDFGQGKDSFVDTIKDVNIYDLIGRPNETVDSAAGTIKFTLELEIRRWGLEGIIIDVSDFVVNRVVINNETEETRHETVAYIKDGIPKDNFKLMIHRTSGKRHIGAYEVEISEARKEIEISFYSI